MASVLVVDDEFGITEVLDALLTDAGHHVRRAINGRQALELVHEQQPDLILLDMMMPIMDGPTTLKAIRSDPQSASTPVILMSSLPPDKVVKMVDEAFESILTKPFRAKDAIEAIKAALSGSST
jgi:CheY-like chemotaxis protein